jgi:hypothetical protein
VIYEEDVSRPHLVAFRSGRSFAEADEKNDRIKALVIVRSAKPSYNTGQVDAKVTGCIQSY